jgi:plasmid stability protein
MPTRNGIPVVKTCYEVDADVHKALRIWAAEHGVSMSFGLHKALRLFLEPELAKLEKDEEEKMAQEAAKEAPQAPTGVGP